MEEIKTDSINLIATVKDGGQSVLAIGLKEAYRNKPQYERYLRREFEKGKALDNPGVFKYIDIKEVEGVGLAIETEWEDCRTLAQWLKEASHTDDEKKRVVRQVAAAVGYMHQQGFIWGSLNSHSIFITRKNDNVKILAVTLRFTDILKQPMETLKYLAPEAKDGTVGLDVKADIYSLGILLRDMGFMPEYANVVGTCCRFGRNERFEDVDAFLDAFDRHRYTPRNTATSEDGEPATGGTTNKKMAIIVAVIVVLVGVCVALFVAQGGDDNDNATVQPAATENTDSSAAQQPATADMDSTDKQQPAAPVTDSTTDAAAAPAAAGQYSGDNAFLNDLVPQMHTDLDKIYAQATDPAEARRKVSTYYKGLRSVLRRRHLKAAQLDAFDKAFAEYNTQKRQQQ